MLYRPCAALIGVFWLVMAGLLVRQHVGAGDAALREVTVAHVVKLLLTHEQPSDLNIFSATSGGSGTCSPRSRARRASGSCGMAPGSWRKRWPPGSSRLG